MRVPLALQRQVVLSDEVLPVVLGSPRKDIAGQPLRRVALPRQQEAGAPPELGDVAERTVPRGVRARPRAGANRTRAAARRHPLRPRGGDGAVCAGDVGVHRLAGEPPGGLLRLLAHGLWLDRYTRGGRRGRRGVRRRRVPPPGCRRVPRTRARQKRPLGAAARSGCTD